MNNRLKTVWLFIFLLLFTPFIASAHTIGGNGLASGLTHPVLGFDHLLAMVAVGIISLRFGSKKMWLIPGTFVLFMIAGGVLGVLGFKLVAVEIVIALSVIFLGLAIAMSRRPSLIWSIIVVAGFAIFHGHAHGQEIPAIVNPVPYIMGFVLATVSLHITGLLIGHYARKTKLTAQALHYLGWGMGLTGIYFLLGF